MTRSAVRSEWRRMALLVTPRLATTGRVVTPTAGHHGLLVRLRPVRKARGCPPHPPADLRQRPTTHACRCREMLHGDGADRWLDKSFQLLVQVLLPPLPTTPQPRQVLLSPSLSLRCSCPLFPRGCSCRPTARRRSTSSMRGATASPSSATSTKSSTRRRPFAAAAAAAAAAAPAAVRLRLRAGFPSTCRRRSRRRCATRSRDSTRRLARRSSPCSRASK